MRGPDDGQNFFGETPSEAFDLAAAQVCGVHGDAALGAAERQVHDAALPRHPHGQGGDLAEIHAGVVAQPALGRAAGERVLHAVAEERLRLARIAANGDAHHHRARLGRAKRSSTPESISECSATVASCRCAIWNIGELSNNGCGVCGRLLAFGGAERAGMAQAPWLGTCNGGEDAVTPFYNLGGRGHAALDGTWATVVAVSEKRYQINLPSPTSPRRRQRGQPQRNLRFAAVMAHDIMTVSRRLHSSRLRFPPCAVTSA